MKPDESFLSQPIRSLQTMLRILAEQDDRYETLIPDGIYGPATVSAVSRFQRMNGLPVTGVTDQRTWDSVVSAHEAARIQVLEAELLEVVLDTNQQLRRGERHPHVRLVQALLAVLQDTYGSIGPVSHTGILDEPTSQALGTFQALSGLKVTGNLDKQTWKHLALQYPLAAFLFEAR